MEPSRLTRRILPASVLKSCALVPAPASFSATDTYNLASGPNRSAPEWWFAPDGKSCSSGVGFVPLLADSVKRTTCVDPVALELSLDSPPAVAYETYT